MGWLVRISFENYSETTDELLASELWDLGTTGLFQNGTGETVAGFETKDEALAAKTALTNTGLGDTGLGVTEDVSASTIGVEPAPTAEQLAPEDRPIPVNMWIGGDQQVELQIRAGGAFGHGRHHTTKLSLDLLLRHVKPGDRVLDVGTGTGILAIAAGFAGAGAVVGLDNDPVAVEVATDNVAANLPAILALDGRTRNDVSITVGQWTVEEGLANLGGPPNLVLINVLLPVHRELKDAIIGGMSSGATLITAGYLDEQQHEVIGLYCPPAAVVADHQQGDWAANVFILGID